MIRAIVSLACAIVSTGCIPQHSMSSTPDVDFRPVALREGRKIYPEPTSVVGYVYRSVDTVTSPSEIIKLKKICTDDFVITNSLNYISKKYQDAEGIEVLGPALEVQDKTSGFSLTGIKVSGISLGSGANMLDKVESKWGAVHKIELSEADQKAISEGLGAKCQSLIGSWRAKGHGAFVVLAGYLQKSFSVKFSVGSEFNAVAGGNAKVGLTEIEIGRLQLKRDDTRVYEQSFGPRFIAVSSLDTL